MAEFWTIRAGRHGERVEWALENGVIGGGWIEFSDLTPFSNNREDLRAVVAEALPGSTHRIANYTGQLWSMIHRIQPGAYIVLPIRATSQVAIGQVTKGYHYVPDEPDDSKRHRLGVKWLRTDISKALIKQDLLYQLGSALTVFEIGNADAAYRLEQLLQGRPDPGARGTRTQASSKDSDQTMGQRTEVEIEGEALDLEEVAQDEIARNLQQDFKGHELSELITAILHAEGFTCRNSPPGADGGVDVLCGMGPLGMDSPRLVVQVKSQTSAVSDVVLQQLNGAILRYNADQALLVTFGGVTAPARAYLESQYFKVRVWTMADILNKIFEHYEVLPSELKARLPLKQIWIPVADESST
jgi:restriction system protein